MHSRVPEEFPFIGVDFGSQLAGTTAAAWVAEDVLTVRQSTKGKSADRFLNDLVAATGPATVYLDAPLSLPGVYRGLTGCDDWFYRDCDRAARSMSPMFLGGLTARAMRLAAGLVGQAEFVETYPKSVWRSIAPDSFIHEGRRRTVPDPDHWDHLAGVLPLPVARNAPRNNHAFDAVLAWLGGWRHHLGQATVYGRPDEGIIIG